MHCHTNPGADNLFCMCVLVVVFHSSNVSSVNITVVFYGNTMDSQEKTFCILCLSVYFIDAHGLLSGRKKKTTENLHCLVHLHKI